MIFPISQSNKWCNIWSIITFNRIQQKLLPDIFISSYKPLHFFPQISLSQNSIHNYPGFIILLTVFQWWGMIKENKIVACCLICSNVFSIRLSTLTFQGQKTISIEISFRFICAWVYFFTVMQTFPFPCCNFLIFHSNVNLLNISHAISFNIEKMYLQFLWFKKLDLFEHLYIIKSK